MNYYIGQEFENNYPPEAALWCNGNGAVMVAAGHRRYRIAAIPQPSVEELQDYKRAERNRAMNDFTWRVERYNEQADLHALAPEKYAEPTDKKVYLLAYRQFLRDWTKQENWWSLDIPSYDTWLHENGFDKTEEES